MKTPKPKGRERVTVVLTVEERAALADAFPSQAILKSAEPRYYTLESAVRKLRAARVARWGR